MFETRFGKTGELPPSPLNQGGAFRSSHSRHARQNGRTSGMRLTAENALSNPLSSSQPPGNPSYNPVKKDGYLAEISKDRNARAAAREKLGSRKGTASGRRQLGDGNGSLRNNFGRGLNMNASGNYGGGQPPPQQQQIQQQNNPGRRQPQQRQLNGTNRLAGTQRQQRAMRANNKLPALQHQGQMPAVGGVGVGAGARAPLANRQTNMNMNASGTLGGRELQKTFESTPNAGVCSITGLKPGNPNWINQDNFIAQEGRVGNTDEAMFCVLDGHGQQGHLVSTQCRERLPQLYRETGNDLSRTCLAMQAELEKSTAMDVKCSGATCVICVVNGRRLTVGNLGDSKAVLGRRVNGVTLPHPLTNDHKPDRPDERQRILQAGGKVGCRQLVVGNGPNGPVRLPMGPMRIWYQVRGETMGLAMSRSLGDGIVHALGVSADPELTEHLLDGEDLFLLLGSDGIWDVTDLNQAVQIVQGVVNKNPHGWDPREAAEELAVSARRRWESMSQMVDDITAIVVKLQ